MIAEYFISADGNENSILKSLKDDNDKMRKEYETLMRKFKEKETEIEKSNQLFSIFD